MNIFYQHECLSCSYYNKEDMDPMMKKIELNKNYKFDLLATENKIVFLIQGAISFALDQYLDKEMIESEMLVIPQ